MNGAGPTGNLLVRAHGIKTTLTIKKNVELKRRQTIVRKKYIGAETTNNNLLAHSIGIRQIPLSSVETRGMTVQKCAIRIPLYITMIIQQKIEAALYKGIKEITQDPTSNKAKGRNNPTTPPPIYLNRESKGLRHNPSSLGLYFPKKPL